MFMPRSDNKLSPLRPHSSRTRTQATSLDDSGRPMTPLSEDKFPREMKIVAVQPIGEPAARGDGTESQLGVLPAADAADGRIACPFEEFGCEKRDHVDVVKKHIRDQRFDHLMQLCNAVRVLQQEARLRLDANVDYVCAAQDVLTKSAGVQTLFGAQLTWRIDNFNRVTRNMKQGDLLHSSPFFSHKHGYKMSASLAPKGDLDHFGYTSIFVSLLKCENDPVQLWPFTSETRFMLIDQSGEGKHELAVLCPRATPSNEPFLGRPVAARNPSFGLPKFIKQDELQRFVKDDVLFIQVEVVIRHA